MTTETHATLPLRVWRRATVLAQQPTMRGMACMIASTIAFAFMTVLIRSLSKEIHPFEIAFFRFFFGFVLLSPMLIRKGIGLLRTRQPALQIGRGVVNVMMTLSLFMGISMVPIAKVTALQFTAPLFASALALLLLREAPRLIRIVALAIGFAGTLVIVRPGIIGVDLGSGLVLFSAVMLALMMIAVKILSRTDSSVTTVLFAAIMVTPASFGLALFFWVTPTLEQFGVLAAMGVLGTIGQLGLAQAFKEADVTQIMPLNFLSLVWVAILGYIAFSEVPDVWTWIGGAMIFAASTHIAILEARESRPR
ncbi:MAG: DMT family transporter [Rhodospirillales bacterium]|nr:DMT family transporter [Rhodospirillales bacterium]